MPVDEDFGAHERRTGFSRKANTAHFRAADRDDKARHDHYLGLREIADRLCRTLKLEPASPAWQRVFATCLLATYYENDRLRHEVIKAVAGKIGDDLHCLLGHALERLPGEGGLPWAPE